MLLGEVGFSYNTLRHHLEHLAAQGFAIRKKVASHGFGVPRFTYHVPSKTIKQVTAALQDTYVELLTLPFSRLKHVCRFEKDGHCKETKRAAQLKTAPKSENKNYDHFTPFSGSELKRKGREVIASSKNRREAISHRNIAREDTVYW